MKPRVYVETTIPSMLVARPSRDVVVAANQQVTIEWWETRRRHHELLVSAFVLDEAARGDSEAAAQRLGIVNRLKILVFTPDAESLAGAILSSRLIPPKAAPDAAHIAVAAVHGMDFLLTWNCRHIANAAIQERLRGLCRRFGYSLPVICTPQELMLR